MSEHKTCQTCAMAVMLVDDDGPVVECRRFPPMDDGQPDMPELLPPPDDDLELVAEYDELVAESMMLEVRGVLRRFPVVRSDDWCGEWRAER